MQVSSLSRSRGIHPGQQECFATSVTPSIQRTTQLDFPGDGFIHCGVTRCRDNIGLVVIRCEYVCTFVVLAEIQPHPLFAFRHTKTHQCFRHHKE